LKGLKLTVLEQGLHLGGTDHHNDHGGGMGLQSGEAKASTNSIRFTEGIVLPLLILLSILGYLFSLSF
jgi:hypothetical protein